MMESGQVFNPYRLFVGSFIPNCLMRYQGISSSSKLIWARLAQYAGDGGIAYPRQVTLAAEVGISDRAVRMCLTELVEKGFLRVNKPGSGDRINGGSDRYEFLFHPCFNGSGDHRKKVPVPLELSSGGQDNEAEEVSLRQSDPPKSPQGGSSASGLLKDNGKDLIPLGEMSNLLHEFGQKLASKSLSLTGLNGRSAPPP